MLVVFLALRLDYLIVLRGSILSVFNFVLALCLALHSAIFENLAVSVFFANSWEHFLGLIIDNAISCTSYRLLWVLAVMEHT